MVRDASGELRFVPDSPEYGGYLLSSPPSTIMRRVLGRFKVYQWFEEQLVYRQGLPQQLVSHRVEQILSFDTGEVEMAGLKEVQNMADIDLGFEAEEITPVFREALNVFEFGLNCSKKRRVDPMHTLCFLRRIPWKTCQRVQTICVRPLES